MNHDIGVSEFKNKFDFSRTKGIMDILYYGAIILLFISIIAGLYFSFLPPDYFTAEKDLNSWDLRVNFRNHSFFIGAPFSVLPSASSSSFSAKSAFLTILIANIYIGFSVYILGIKLVRDTLLTTLEGEPFAFKNIHRLKLLGWVIIFYSLFHKLVINILSIILITNFFSLDLVNISVKGIVIGTLVLCLAKIFEYGAFLQEEHDTTL